MMKPVARILTLLLASTLAFGGAACSDDAESASDKDLRLLVEKTKNAYEANDKQVTALLEKLYLKVTGLPDTSENVPEGMSVIEFEERLCRFWKITAPFYAPEELEYFRHDERLLGYLIVDSGDENNTRVQLRINCGKEVGKQAPLSRATEDGIAWAKKLRSASPDEARAMASEYDELIQNYPEKELYKRLRFLALREAEKRERHQARQAQ
ncbi:MAG: hypothetical protein HQL44_07635 [Alphaproteobacteria bacterium]|nr:hypothetical protein [Alphaproteobacteria bacterium]